MRPFGEATNQAPAASGPSFGGQAQQSTGSVYGAAASTTSAPNPTEVNDEASVSAPSPSPFTNEVDYSRVGNPKWLPPNFDKGTIQM